MRSLEEILKESSSRHRHLCPRQVLGARMALYASELLDLELPRDDKRLLVIAETDGCTVDGLIAATHCRVGSRTLRILDFGKVAATFADSQLDISIRVCPRHNIRTIAQNHAPNAKNKWEAMLMGYQSMPADVLFSASHVHLDTPLDQILSKPGKKSMCEMCGEEIINGREVFKNNVVQCRACAGDSYYQLSTISNALHMD
ncbi:MAG TPA: FmdE family protein [Anaerolineales bacterium]|nr:FmdE family protein [Anaerolineales bacterium]